MERESAQATDTILDSDGLEDHGHTLPPVLPAPSHHFIPRMQPLLLHPIFRFHVPLNSPSPSYRTRIDPRHRYRPHHPQATCQQHVFDNLEESVLVGSTHARNLEVEIGGVSRGEGE